MGKERSLPVTDVVLFDRLPADASQHERCRAKAQDEPAPVFRLFSLPAMWTCSKPLEG